MSKTNKMILLASLVILVLVWYFTDTTLLKKRKELTGASQYGFDTLNTNPNVNWVLKGCTDPSAANYNPDATSDDGTCYTIAGCCDVHATNYNPEADSCNIPQNNETLCNYNNPTTGWSIFNTYGIEKTPCSFSANDGCGFSWSAISKPQWCKAHTSIRDTSRYIY